LIRWRRDDGARARTSESRGLVSRIITKHSDTPFRLNALFLLAIIHNLLFNVQSVLRAVLFVKVSVLARALFLRYCTYQAQQI
jgi:hypothetical protein